MEGSGNQMVKKPGKKRPGMVTAISMMMIASGALNILISLIKFIPLLFIGVPFLLFFLLMGFGLLSNTPVMGILFILLSLLILVLLILSLFAPFIWAVIEIRNGVNILGAKRRRRITFWFGIIQAMVGVLNFNVISLVIGLVNAALLAQPDVKAYLDPPRKKRRK